VEPDEVAKAFDHLHESGKVRYFGVSNHTAGQIELLKKSVRQPLVVNQVQLGLMHPYLIAEGLDFNRQGDRRLEQEYVGAAGLLDYCRQNDIQIQAYSPVRGLSAKAPGATESAKQTRQLLQEMSEKKSSSPFALGLAWLLRHPAGIVPIVGANKPEHIIENCTADTVALERREWYSLLYAATGLPSSKVT
jgi:predicted oxidoreductase